MGYIICEKHCETKMWSPLFKMIQHFKMATTRHQTKRRPLLTLGPCVMTQAEQAHEAGWPCRHRTSALPLCARKPLPQLRPLP